MSQTRNKQSVTLDSEKSLELTQQALISGGGVLVSSKAKKKKTHKSAKQAEQDVLAEQLLAQAEVLSIAEDAPVLGAAQEHVTTEEAAANVLLTQDERVDNVLADEVDGDARAHSHALEGLPQELAYSVTVSESSMVLAQAAQTSVSDAPSGGAESSMGLSWTTLGLAALGVGVIAGASGGSSSPKTTPSGKEFTLNGKIAAGPLTKVTGLVLEAYDGNGNLLKNSSGTINSDGTYDFKIAAADNFAGGALRLVVKDTDDAPDYVDEATKAPKDLLDGMLAVVVYLDSQVSTSVKANVTTLTGLAAAKLANGADKATIESTNVSVATLFGLSADPVSAEIKLAIASDGSVQTDVNAYGSVLAILSQVQKSGVSFSSLTSGVQVTNSGKTATLTGSAVNAVIAAVKVANAQGFVSAEQSAQVQQKALGNISNPVVIEFTDGSGVSMQPTASYTPMVKQQNAGAIKYVLEGADSGAFDLDAATGKLTLKSSELASASGPGGKLYKVLLKATADLGTAQTTDDVVVYQPLSITVKDTVAPSMLQLSLVSGDKLNKALALSDKGILSFTQSADADKVVLTLRNAAGKGIDKTFVGAQDQLLVLTAEDLAVLGDGQITISAVAVDLAGNKSAASESKVSVVTSALPPSLSLVLDNGPNKTDGITSNPEIKVDGLAADAVWYYSTDGGQTFTKGEGSKLDLRALGSGQHTVQAKQVDAYGNESNIAALSVDFRLDAPLGLNATISQFSYKRDDQSISSDALFSAGLGASDGSRIFELKGTFRGQLPKNYKVELVLTSGDKSTVQDLSTQIASGSGEWAINNGLGLPLSSSHHGQIQIWLTDDYGNKTLITSRAYAYEKQDTTTLGATVLLSAAGFDGFEASGIDLALPVLKEGIVAEYQLTSEENSPDPARNWLSYADLIASLTGSNALVAGGKYSVYVRSRDLLTGQISSEVGKSFSYNPKSSLTTNAEVSSSVELLLPQPANDTSPDVLTLNDLAVRSEQDQSQWVTAGGRDYDTILAKTQARVGETVYLQWGHIVKQKVVQDAGAFIGFQFTTSELKAQQGKVGASIWAVDKQGHVSSTQTVVYTVDTSDAQADANKPKILAIRSSATGTADAGKTVDLDNTFNINEVKNGLAVDVSVPAKQGGWADVALFGNKALKLTLYRVYQSGGQTVEEQVASQSFVATEVQTGQVRFDLKASQVNTVQGVQSWKVELRDYSKSGLDALSQSLSTEVVVDTEEPGAVAFTLESTDAVLNAQESGLQFKVATNALVEGDRIVFTLKRGTAPETKIQHYVQAGEIIKDSASGQAAVLVTLSKTELSLGSDGQTTVMAAVVDKAGNLKTPVSTQYVVTVDTQAPAAVAVAIPDGDAGKDGFINASESAVTVDIALANSNAKASDTLQLLLGPDAMTAHRVQLTQADIDAGKKTFVIPKSELGMDGLKQFRAYLIDAAGNQGDLLVANHADVILDTLAHAQPNLAVAAGGGSLYLKNDAQVTLEVADAQLSLGDKVEFFLRGGALATDTLWKSFSITDDTVRSVSNAVMESALFAAGGLDNLSEGVYTITAKTTDKAGNVSVASKPLTLVVDRTAPDTVITVPALSDDTGIAGPQANGPVVDFVTKAASQTLTAQLSAPLKTDATGKESVWASLNGGTEWTDVTSFVNGQTLSWATTLLSGPNDLKLEVRDQAGNVGQTLLQRYVLDETAPVISLTGALAFSADTAPTNNTNPALASDFITRVATQTITLDLSRALIVDNDSATLRSGTEALFASLDDGKTWTDVTASVAGTRLTWQGVTLTGSSNLKFKVVDLAGNESDIRSQAYVLDTVGPAAKVSGIHFITDTGISSNDFITSEASTEVKLTLNGALTDGDRVFYKVNDSAAPVDITVFMNDIDKYTFNIPQLTAGHENITVWVEDRAGNRITTNDLQQSYIYAASLPLLDLSTTQNGSGFARNVSLSDAQLGSVAMTGDVSVTTTADVSEIKITSFIADPNNNDERLFLSPELDINMTALRQDNVFRPADIRQFVVHGTGGDFSVKVDATTGDEIVLTKVNAQGAGAAAFSAAEVSQLLGQLRYVNTADASSVLAGDRSITVTLKDLAGNRSEAVTGTVSLALDANISSSTHATWGDDVRQGSDANDILFGLRGNDAIRGGKGNDVMWGGGGNSQSNDSIGVTKGNDVFVWGAGDADTANGQPAMDTIRDFSPWTVAANGTGSGDKLDLKGLLQGYVDGTSDLANWIKEIKNHETVNGVANSTVITIDVNGPADAGAVQVIQLQGTSLSTTVLSELVQKSVIVI